MVGVWGEGAGRGGRGSGGGADTSQPITCMEGLVPEKNGTYKATCHMAWFCSADGGEERRARLAMEHVEFVFVSFGPFPGSRLGVAGSVGDGCVSPGLSANTCPWLPPPASTGTLQVWPPAALPVDSDEDVAPQLRQEGRAPPIGA